jgi:nucleoside-diphosphate-sugar epimerase
MRYFLTGISGFIGLNLAKALAAGGHKVNAIIRREVSTDLSDIPGLQLFKGDLQDINAMKQAMQGCEAVFHLAAYARPWSKDPGIFHRVNVEGAVNVFNAALESGVKKVVFTSSAATMSPSEGNKPSDESTPRKIPLFNAYEVTKTEAENQAREFCSKGLPVVIVNPSRVYGPGPINPSNSITRMIAGYHKGTWRIIPGDGKMTGNYVFIDDVVYGHMMAAQKGRPGERYILGGENLTFDEFFQVLAKLTGKPRRMVHLPLAFMMAAAKLMEWQVPLTGLPPAITADFVKKYLNHWSLSSEKAVQELDYKVTPFEEGAGKTLEWIEEFQIPNSRFQKLTT